MKLNADGCCGFREGVKDTARNEDIVRCAFHEAWMKARQNAADVLGLLASDLTGGAQVFTGARWARVWTVRNPKNGRSGLHAVAALDSA